jgi:hypothetical protein
MMLTMLDPAEISQVHDLIWQETADMVAIMTQPNGSYRYLCSVRGIIMFTHRPMGTVLREY